ncbi:MAG: acyl-CoA dehydrogenase family protein [Acidimicrobiales bacterium]
MGSRGYETASFVLEDCRLSGDNLLGGEAFYEARKGFKASMATFNMTRPLHTAHGVGMGRAAHDYALDFVRDEYPAQGRRRQRALERLARIRRGLHTARLMYLNAVWLAKTGQSNVLEASFAKMYSPPVVLEAVATAPTSWARPACATTRCSRSCTGTSRSSTSVRAPSRCSATWWPARCCTCPAPEPAAAFDQARRRGPAGAGPRLACAVVQAPVNVASRRSMRARTPSLASLLLSAARTS